MHRDIRTAARRELVERRADLPDRLVATVERRAQDRHHTNRVLITVRDRLISAQARSNPLKTTVACRRGPGNGVRRCPGGRVHRPKSIASFPLALITAYLVQDRAAPAH